MHTCFRCGDRAWKADAADPETRMAAGHQRAMQACLLAAARAVMAPPSPLRPAIARAGGRRDLCTSLRKHRLPSRLSRCTLIGIGMHVKWLKAMQHHINKEGGSVAWHLQLTTQLPCPSYAAGRSPGASCSGSITLGTSNPVTWLRWAHGASITRLADWHAALYIVSCRARHTRRKLRASGRAARLRRAWPRGYEKLAICATLELF